ncbi:MAG: dipeptidase [Oscillospiraceae bacterium]|nr:dipeptidase [Oscillospiraceae bacterium]
MLIIDGHADTLSVALKQGKTLNNLDYSFNINDAFKKAPFIQTLATFVDPKYLKKDSGFKIANNIINKFYSEYEKNKDKLILIKDKTDLEKVIAEKKVGAILSIENGSAIDGKLENVDYFLNMGIKIMSITWNKDNDLGCGALTKNDTGLTDLGKEYVKKLNQKNILTDVSHASEKSFYEVFDISSKPIIATHSCVKELCNHPRNLTNDQIKKIAESGGTIGVCFYNKFLSEKDISTIDDIVKHIEYIVNLVGIDYVSFGTDFEGVKKNELPEGISGVLDFDKIFNKLRDRGFKEEDIEKIAGKNFEKVLKSVAIRINFDVANVGKGKSIK